MKIATMKCGKFEMESQRLVLKLANEAESKGFTPEEIVGMDAVVANRIKNNPMLDMGLKMGALSIDEVLQNEWRGAEEALLSGLPRAAEARKMAAEFGAKHLAFWEELNGLTV